MRRKVWSRQVNEDEEARGQNAPTKMNNLGWRQKQKMKRYQRCMMTFSHTSSEKASTVHLSLTARKVSQFGDMVARCSNQSQRNCPDLMRPQFTESESQFWGFLFAEVASMCCAVTRQSCPPTMKPNSGSIITPPILAAQGPPRGSRE